MMSLSLSCAIYGYSSCCHTFDAFQSAHASFRLYCTKNNQNHGGKSEPFLLGEVPKIHAMPSEGYRGEEDEEEDENSSESLSTMKISCVDSLARWLVSLSVLEHFCDVDYFLLSLEVSSLIADVSGCNFQSQDCLFLSLKNFH